VRLGPDLAIGVEWHFAQVCSAPSSLFARLDVRLVEDQL
jgi:hypothetical protein